MEIRSYLSKQLESGKVDFTLWVEKDATSATASINADMVGNYLRQMQDVSQAHGIAMDGADVWSVLVRMPDVVQTVAVEELSEEEWQGVFALVKVAAEELMQFRAQEGEALAEKFEKNLARIETLMKEIEPFEKSRVEKIRQRLEERLAELTGVDYDRNRMEQELIYYIEKLDINEEKQRLTNHINYFRETMREGHGQGKKLGFIAQEMGREINTTGSKSNQAEMQNIVVMMKDELEQIKEQVLNVM
jgi:uncharacterized protein (TIGR00255 family)